MVDLKIEKLEVFNLEYSAFEELVQRVYGQDYSFVADQEMGNDSEKLFRGITGKLDSYEEGKLKDFKENGNCCYLANALLGDLCRQGHIETGHYLITVCW